MRLDKKPKEWFKKIFKKSLAFNNWFTAILFIFGVYILTNYYVLDDAIKGYIYRFGVFNLSAYIARIFD
jgi:hypothetical protein